MSSVDPKQLPCMYHVGIICVSCVYHGAPNRAQLSDVYEQLVLRAPAAEILRHTAFLSFSLNDPASAAQEGGFA